MYIFDLKEGIADPEFSPTFSAGFVFANLIGFLLFCLSLSCVCMPDFSSVSELSVLDCSFGFF